MQKPQDYDKDFYAWIMSNVELIKQGRLTEIDAEHIVEELEDMGRSEKRQLASRLEVIIMHLLKWQFQPSLQSNSWKYSIKEQRIRICNLLKESPSLHRVLETMVDSTYEQAVVMAVKETGLSESSFPPKCPYTLAECLDADFFPE
jgi:hypothetical protein